MNNKLLTRNIRNRRSWHSVSLRFWITLRDAGAGYITYPANQLTCIYMEAN